MSPILKLIPNLLSVSRIILLIPFLFSVKANDLPAMIVLSALIVASDFLDGFLARRWNATSATGRIIDPLADKICIAASGVALVVLRNFPPSLMVALVARDLLILSAGAIIIKRIGSVPASNIPGKIAAGVFSACLLIYLFKLDFLKMISVAAAWIMLIFSLASYSLAFYNKIKAAGLNK